MDILKWANHMLSDKHVKITTLNKSLQKGPKTLIVYSFDYNLRFSWNISHTVPIITITHKSNNIVSTWSQRDDSAPGCPWVSRAIPWMAGPLSCTPLPAYLTGLFMDLTRPETGSERRKKNKKTDKDGRSGETWRGKKREGGGQENYIELRDSCPRELAQVLRETGWSTWLKENWKWSIS